MKDIILLETCKKCGEHITLMESVNTESNKLMLVKRCLNCGNYPVTEVVEAINDTSKAYCGEYCEEWINPVRTIEKVNMDIRGVKFSFNKIINRCPKCDNEVYVERDNKENVKVAHELYLKAKEDN